MHSLFKTHPHNIKQLKACIKANGPTYFHGDGNFYPVKNGEVHSTNNVEYSNPKQSESKYRKLYSSVSEVPDTIEELNEQLMAEKNNDILKERASLNKAVTTTFAVDDDDDEQAGGDQTTATKKGGKGGAGKGKGKNTDAGSNSDDEQAGGDQNQ